MNCREAQNHIFAARDAALDAGSRTSLAAHLAECADCRRIQNELAAIIATWRTAAESVTIPDSEREWHAVRRRIRGAPTGAELSRPRRNVLAWLTLPAAAAAAVAIGLFVTREQPASSGFEAVTRIAQADHVEAPGRDASIVISVDAKTGALFVVASDVPHAGD